MQRAPAFTRGSSVRHCCCSKICALFPPEEEEATLRVFVYICIYIFATASSFLTYMRAASRRLKRNTFWLLVNYKQLRASQYSFIYTYIR